MNISKIQNTTNFGQISFNYPKRFQPLLNGNINAMEHASKGAYVNVSTTDFYPFDDFAIKVSASSPSLKPKFAQVDIYVRSTEENIKNKAVVDAVKEAVKLVKAD